jgi:hypothetical protein
MIFLFPGRGMMEKVARQKKGSLTGNASGVIAGRKGEFGFAHKMVPKVRVILELQKD